MSDLRDMARRAVERSRQEQGLPPRVTDRRALERVAGLLSSATPDRNGPDRNGYSRVDQDQPRHAPARQR